MKKEEATTKKTEAKEAGAPTKKTEAKEAGATLTVTYKDIQNKRKLKVGLYVFLAAFVLAGLLALILTLIKVRDPQFMLDDVSLDPISGSKVLVKLSSTNPSSSSLSYSDMSLYVQIEEIFETERVFLQSTVQKPHERTTWTGVVARNNVNNDRPDGTFQMRDGVENGNVIAEVKIKKKSLMFSQKSRLRVTCPVLLNLKDLTAVVSRPMSTCQVL